MRIFGRTITAQRPGRITVDELAHRGLDRYPTAIAVYWPDTQNIVCRRHATTPEHIQAMTQLRPITDEATLLIGGEEAARRLHRQCVLCS
jgi:hypothetical protein